MKISFSVILLLSCVLSYAQPANDNCASATVLTVDAALSCGQTTQNATLQGGECFTNYGGGVTEYTTWYRFTANNDSIILNFIQTNYPNCYPEVSVYGPFAAGAGCQPSCASTLYNALQNGDPGSHILLTGLNTTGNNNYLIQIQNNQCGGPGSSYVTYCINLQQPEGNNTAATADLLDQCGTAFSNSTNGGYWQTGTSAGFNNLDGNNGTTCGGCAAGDDTPFIINNVSWTTFCALTNGTWQVTVSGISGCTLPAPNQGVQASIFTGIPTALVNQGNSPNPIPPGGTWVSGILTVNTGQCAYLMIDGFAGDACNYSVTLTNLSGGCIVLPIELLSFEAIDEGDLIKLKWSTASENNNDFYIVESSLDGQNYEFLSQINGAGNSSSLKSYQISDNRLLNNEIFYRLKQVDYDGNIRIMGYAKIVRLKEEPLSLNIFPNPSLSGNVPEIIFNGKLDESYIFEIIDFTGKLIENGVIISNQSSQNSIKLNSQFVSGIYIFRITDKYGKSITEKLVIE